MITMHGSNKLLGELERAVATGVGHVVWSTCSRKSPGLPTSPRNAMA